MNGLSFQQWLQLLAATPRIVEHLRRALPTLIPLIKEVVAVIEDLKLEEPIHKPVAPNEAVKKLQTKKGFTPEEKELFERMSNIQ